MQSNTALKEWQAVCRAIETGRQIFLLRKGGIHETEGRFEIEQRNFYLFPTWLHQKSEWIQPDAQAFVQHRTEEPDQIELRVFTTVTDIIRIHSRQQFQDHDQSHIYLPPLIDMRFNYKPHNPLYALVVRAWILDRPITITNTPAYAGCKSWVPLEQELPTGTMTQVLDDHQFNEARENFCRNLAKIPKL